MTQQDKVKLTKTTKDRLKVIYDNLTTINYNNNEYLGIYVEKFGKLTNNNKPTSLASQLSQPGIKQYFNYMTKANLLDKTNDKTFIYLKGNKEETLETLKQDLQQEETNN